MPWETKCILYPMSLNNQFIDHNNQTNGPIPIFGISLIIFDMFENISQSNMKADSSRLINKILKKYKTCQTDRILTQNQF